MANSETALAAPLTFSYVERYSRQIFISLMQSLPEGHLVIKENGKLIAQCGNPASDLQAEVDMHCPTVYKKTVAWRQCGLW